jgi:hypothetical protein
VVAFVEANYGAILDAGLMDEVLMEEYKQSVIKLEEFKTASSKEKQKQAEQLGFVLWTMVDNASQNIASGRYNPVHVELLKAISEIINTEKISC